MAAREIELINDRELARKRLPIFAGQDVPSTVVRKEIVDNGVDVVNERGQRADECIIRIGPNRLQVMDNGSGISTKIKEGTDKTHLWLACAKMFSSSNYGGTMESVGANGVGLTIANYTSKRFFIGLFNKNNVEGYLFIDGYLAGTQECIDNVAQNHEHMKERDIADAKSEGDMVSNPISVEDGKARFAPHYDIGFMVDVEWFQPGVMKIFPDEFNPRWLMNYIKLRVGELNAGRVTVELYRNDDFDESALVERNLWGRNIEDADGFEYVKSWNERCEEVGAVIVKEGPWQIALSTDESMKIDSIVQGAPVNAPYNYGIPITIQEYRVTVHVPVSFKFQSKEYPAYQDQTKMGVRFPYKEFNSAFQRSGDVYKYFYHEAEKAYMAKVIKDSDSSMFWPALGEPSESELIIAEGYSAISGLKSQRDPMTQACIALRGKILNCWNLDMQKSMRSDVVKQMLNATIYTPYTRVIIATDEDPDGFHIRGLLLALFARYTNLIQEGKVYLVHSPHYLFKKRGAELKWSDSAADCPKGYHVTTLKGLGGMTPEEVEHFVMNPETRELIQVQWDRLAYQALDHAFSYGGENWIQQ